MKLHNHNEKEISDIIIEGNIEEEHASMKRITSNGTIISGIVGFGSYGATALLGPESQAYSTAAMGTALGLAGIVIFGTGRAYYHLMDYLSMSERKKSDNSDMVDEPRIDPGHGIDACEIREYARYKNYH